LSYVNLNCENKVIKCKTVRKEYIHIGRIWAEITAILNKSCLVGGFTWTK